MFDVGPDFPIQTMRLVGQERGYAATAGVPTIALRVADTISRSWLKARQSRYPGEIDEIASLSKRPGAYFLNVDYKRGCRTAAKPATDGTTARLLRVLDWNVNGLGRYVHCSARSECVRSMGITDMAGLYRRPAGGGALTLRSGPQSAKHQKEDRRHCLRS